MRQGQCKRCNRVVALEHDRTFGRDVLVEHQDSAYTWSSRCEASGMPMFYPVEGPRVPSRHGDGKRATAPCGHPGTHVTPSMVLCDLEWCDGRAPSAAPPRLPGFSIHTCAHAARRTLYGTTTCLHCGAVLS